MKPLLAQSGAGGVGVFAVGAGAATMAGMASALRNVPVEIPGGRYEVYVRPGLLGAVGQVLGGLTPARKAGIVTDSHVEGLHLRALVESLTRAGFQAVTHVVPAGEQHKTLGQLGRIYDTFLAAKIERATPLLALGGGVVGDMTGFAAATILRGVPFVQVPTTLLAMVDASVGGKTAVDHPLGKNLIGAFNQPLAVLIDPAVLTTLPARELRGGLAECIKHEIIRDAAGFERLERDIGRAIALDVEYLADLVAHNVAIKAKVVAADPRERGERAHLNFGHTVGHAIETLSGYQHSHGEAVALGMVAASQLAVKLGLLADAERSRITGLIGRAGLPTRGLTLDVDAVLQSMAFDKKVQAGRVRFVLPDRIGHVVMRDDVPAELVREAVASLRA